MDPLVPVGPTSGISQYTAREGRGGGGGFDPDIFCGWVAVRSCFESWLEREGIGMWLAPAVAIVVQAVAIVVQAVAIVVRRTLHATYRGRASGGKCGGRERHAPHRTRPGGGGSPPPLWPGPFGPRSDLLLCAWTC